MSDIKHRLRASVRMDAVHGDTHERSVCARQMVEAANEIERLTAERDELRRQLAEANRRFDWLAERLEDVQIDNADPNDNYLDDEEDVPYTVLWRRAIDAAMGLTRPAEE